MSFFFKLHHELLHVCYTCSKHHEAYITSGESVVSVGSGNPGMLECNHEEADTRIVVPCFATGNEEN